MFGVEANQLKPIHSVAKQLDPQYNPEKIGAWGMLFLCCGAMAAGNPFWRDRVMKSETFINPSDMDKMLTGSNICTSDEYASKFSEWIKKLNNYDYAIAESERRMEKYRGKLSDVVFINNKTYLTLAFMLNSFESASKDELLGFDCSTWVNMSTGKKQNYGWPELFFAAGLLLNNENSVDWQKMASVIHAMGKSINVDVASLYAHYAGNNVISATKKAKIRTDQLTKGTRVRMRNGWEAIVVEPCKGNTLVAKVFGDFTETGNVYAHNIVATEVDGKWVEVEMTEEQMQFYEQLKMFSRQG